MSHAPEPLPALYVPGSHTVHASAPEKPGRHKQSPGVVDPEGEDALACQGANNHFAEM